MNIVCSINRGYIVQFCTMATSLLLNTASKEVYFYILNKDLLKEDEEIILNYIQGVNNLSNAYFIKVNIDNLTNLLTNNTHLTEETFYRIYIGELLPSEIDKVLYLDSDIIIEKDVYELYSTDISRYLIAAVTDYNSERWKTLNLISNLDYFNAGVILVNLKKFRNDNLLEKCMQFIKQNKTELIYADQDILNAVINGQWLRLHNRWNVIRQWYMQDPYLLNFISAKDLVAIINDPGIIHYTSSIKPWKLICDHPKKDRYKYYFRETNMKEIINNKKTNEFLNKEIVIFGASIAGKKMFYLLKEKNVSVVNFLDNDLSKSGKNYLGKEIIHPNNFKKKENEFIVIASQYESEISEQLNKMGYKLNIDYTIGLHGLCKMI